MAIIDKLTEFGVQVDLSQAAGTYLFTNQIDMQVVRDIAAGHVVYCVIKIIEAVDSAGGAATINFRLRSDDSASIHATTSSAHGETGAIGEALLAAGKQLVIALPVEGIAYERYLGLQAVIAGETTTTGTATAFLTLDPPEAWKANPGNYGPA